MKINENYKNLEESYLFSTIAKKVDEYTKAHPEAKVIKMGIGDVTLPICQKAADAFAKAAMEQGKAATFHGYGPEQGYDFLRVAVQKYYASFQVEVAAEDIFISDGAKSDVGNILDLFDADNTVLIPDPVYPVYMDTNVMAGRKIVFMDANVENGFLPMPPKGQKADIIYLCSPNNPTGAVYNKEQLKEWVDYALNNHAVILFDSAYEAFISDPELPRSIYAIEGAKKCAIEFCSLSKTAGFTGTRCGYTVVPRELVFTASNGQEMSLHAMWNRRQSTKFNGTSYIIQKGAAAVFTEEGMAQCRENIAYYQENARIIADTLTRRNIRFFGGVHSPYIWFECPDGMESWEFFDYLLNNAQVVGTPGAGFGENGKNYFRLTSFNNHENTIAAMKRFEHLF